MRRLMCAVTFVIVLAVASSASADFLNVSAAAFGTNADSTYLEGSGVVQGDAATTLRAPVTFTVAGHTLCRMWLYVHDFDSNNVTLRLMRKPAALSGTFGGSPETVATRTSSGAVDAMRTFSTTSFTPAAISLDHFYWLELEFGGGPIQVIGARIRYGATC